MRCYYLQFAVGRQLRQEDVFPGEHLQRNEAGQRAFPYRAIRRCPYVLSERFTTNKAPHFETYKLGHEEALAGG